MPRTGAPSPTKAADEVAVQADRADGDGRLAGELLGPARQVQVRAVELGQPVAAGGGVEGVDAGRGQRGQDRLQLLRGLGEPRVVVLLLPLRVAEDHREVGRDGRADRGHDLGGELRAGHGVAAVGVGPAVGALPQELVDQVAVGAVQLDAVEADALGVRRGLRRTRR